MTALPQQHRMRATCALTCLVLLAVYGCVVPPQSYGPIGPEQLHTQEHDLEKLRKLQFNRAVHLSFVSRPAAEQILLGDYLRDRTLAEVKSDAAAGAMLGLYPAGIDAKALILSAARDRFDAFYDPRNDLIIMQPLNVPHSWTVYREYRGINFLLFPAILNHELTHALTDQNFQSGKRLDAIRNNIDRRLAFKAVNEGDATLIEVFTESGSQRFDSAFVRKALSTLDNLPKTLSEQGQTPEESGLTAQTRLEYIDGAKFVAEAWKRGGWAAVDELYKNPPQSTQQILQPALYFDHPTEPLTIHVSGYRTVMDGWKKAGENTYGEFLIETILTRKLPAGAPTLPCTRQWAGDRLVVLRKGKDYSVIWIVAFRDAQSARAFEIVYGSTLDNLTDEPPHAIQRRATYVLVVAGDAAKDMSKLGIAVWKASTVGGKHLPAVVLN